MNGQLMKVVEQKELLGTVSIPHKPVPSETILIGPFSFMEMMNSRLTTFIAFKTISITKKDVK